MSFRDWLFSLTRKAIADPDVFLDRHLDIKMLKKMAVQGFMGTTLMFASPTTKKIEKIYPFLQKLREQDFLVEGKLEFGKQEENPEWTIRIQWDETETNPRFGSEACRLKELCKNAVAENEWKTAYTSPPTATKEVLEDVANNGCFYYEYYCEQDHLDPIVEMNKWEAEGLQVSHYVYWNGDAIMLNWA